MKTGWSQQPPVWTPHQSCACRYRSEGLRSQELHKQLSAEVMRMLLCIQSIQGAPENLLTGTSGREESENFRLGRWDPCMKTGCWWSAWSCLDPPLERTWSRHGNVHHPRPQACVASSTIKCPQKPAASCTLKSMRQGWLSGH